MQSCTVGSNSSSSSSGSTGYRTDHHLSADEYGVGEPDFERALEFFQQMSLIRQRKSPAGNAHVYAKYPDVRLYLTAEATWKAQDVKRSRSRHWRGLTAYLSDLLGWKRRWQAVFIEEKEQCEMAGGGGGSVASTSRHSGADVDKKRYSSMETGRRVDRELQSLSARTSLMRRDELHPYTVWFIQYCYQRQWLMCGAQVPLWSDDVMTPVRTQADAIVYDLAHRRFILIELKTGYDNDYEQLLHVREPGDQFDDSYYWCHQHQLGWMLHKLRHVLVSSGGGGGGGGGGGDGDGGDERAPTGVVLRISDCVGVRAPHWIEPTIERYYSETHERHSRDTYLVHSGNSMDPYATTDVVHAME